MADESSKFFDFLASNAHYISLGLSAMGLHFNARATRRKMLVEGLPTSKVKGVFIGLVEIVGTSESPTPLVSFVAEKPCVYFSYSVQEHYRRVRQVTVTDSNGRSRSETRVDSGWETIDSQTEMITFELEDDTGRIKVIPEGAEIQADQIASFQVSKFDPMYYQKGPAHGVQGSTGQRMFVEEAILLDRYVTIIGQAEMVGNATAPSIMAASEAPMYLISTKPEAEIIRQYGIHSWISGLAAIIVPVGGYYIYASKVPNPIGAEWLVFSIGGVLLAIVLIRILVIINGLQDIKNRVRQGESLLDVQLQRRYGLIPNLIEVVKQSTKFEAQVHREFALARTYRSRQASVQLQAAQFNMLKEQYPELQSNQQFLKLQKELSGTEDRIALARTYMLQIAHNYNRQIEVFPNSVLSRMIGLRLHEPINIIDDPSQTKPVAVKL